MNTEKSIFDKSYSAESSATKAVEKEYGSNWSQVVELFQTENKRWSVRPIYLETEINSVDNLADEALIDYDATGAEVGEVEDLDVTGGDEPPAPVKDMSNVLSTHRKTYEKVLSYKGNISLDNGDDIASILRGMSPDQVCSVADAVKDQPDGFHVIKYAKLNNGQIRMNSGNVIRGAMSSGTHTIEDIKAIIARVRG